MVDENDVSEDDEESIGGRIPSSIRKALLNGMSAVMMTEEGIRGALSDLKLPKEAMGFVLQQTERSRKELFQFVSGEMKGFLKSVDLPSAFRKAITGLKMEVQAEVRFLEDDTKARVHSSIKDAATTKRSGRKKKVSKS